MNVKKDCEAIGLVYTKSNKVIKLTNCFYYYDSLTKDDAMDLLELTKIKKGHYYYAYKDPIGTHTLVLKKKMVADVVGLIGSHDFHQVLYRFLWSYFFIDAKFEGVDFPIFESVEQMLSVNRSCLNIGFGLNADNKWVMALLDDNVFLTENICVAVQKVKELNNPHAKIREIPRIKHSSEWEQGNYFYDCEWHMTTALDEYLSINEIKYIIDDVESLVAQFGGIDSHLFYQVKDGETICVTNHYPNKGVFNNKIVLMLSSER